jgi:DNA gyrase subunit B
VTVRDNAREIPADIHLIDGVSAAEIIMTRLHGSVKFEPTAHGMFRARHGVGVSVVDALSEAFDLPVWRSGQDHFMRFRLGDPEAPSAVVGNAACWVGNRGAEPRSLSFHGPRSSPRPNSISRRSSAIYANSRFSIAA